MHTLCTNAIERKVSTLLFQKGFYHIFQARFQNYKKKDIVSYCEGSVSSEAAFFLKKDLMTWYGVKCQSCQMSN